MIITATNYTCKSFWDGKHEYKVLQTPATNIQLVSIYKNGTCQSVLGSKNYGMNASFFNSDTNKAILNIAVQSGSSVGTGQYVPDLRGGQVKDGTVNLIGDSVIFWNGSSLNCMNATRYSHDTRLPKAPNTWVQGGIGLYLCDQNWQNKYLAERNAAACALDEVAARTGVLVNKSTKYVYLFACHGLIAVSELRTAMMHYANLTEDGSAGSWAAIMTDGGRSTQLCSREGYVASAMVRDVPQIIALKNKT